MSITSPGQGPEARQVAGVGTSDAGPPAAAGGSPAPGSEVEETPGLTGDGDLQPERHPVRAALRETVIVVGMALLLSLIVKTWLLQAFYIPSASMNDTLVQGDRVIVSKLTPGPFALERGDIVVFEDPDHWLDSLPEPQRSPVGKVVANVLTFVGLMPSDEGNHLIKRVIGLPGDHVVCCDAQGRLTVNGEGVTETYVRPGDSPSALKFDIRVPAGKVWVMGDHRSDSSDSRYHPVGGDGTQGAVPIDNIVGRAVAVVWPVADWSWLGQQPSSTFADVPPAGEEPTDPPTTRGSAPSSPTAHGS